MFLAVACLGGIGFTMSIFVDTLSFGDQIPAVTEQLRATGKIAVLSGSVPASIIGSAFVCAFSFSAPFRRERDLDIAGGRM